MSSNYVYSDGDILDINRKSSVDYIDEIKIEYLHKYLPECGNVLEVGAGSGRMLTRIGLHNKDGYRVIGIDNSHSSPKVIDKNIKEFGLQGSSIRGDTFQLPVRSNTIDVLCSGGLLEHFNTEEINFVVTEMFRVLKPGGLLYADIVPKKKSLCRPIVRKIHWGYENNFTMKQWSGLLFKNGASKVNIFSGLIIPPNFYEWWNGKIQMQIMYKLKSYLMSLDNTFWSNKLGFAYFVFAYKRG